MKIFNFLNKKVRLSEKHVNNISDSYSEWDNVNVRIGGKNEYFHIQRNISSYDIDNIITNYGKFLEGKSSDIEAFCEGDNDITTAKILFGVLYSFLVAYKTDIISKKEKQLTRNIDNDRMLNFVIKFTSLNVFDEIISMFDQDSLKVLFKKFNDVLSMSADSAGINSILKDKGMKGEL